jgi:hypothetical protein
MELNEQERKSLEALTKTLSKQDQNSHQELVREFKKHVNYWSGFQRIHWDRNIMDWRVPTHVTDAQLSEVGASRSDFGRVINIMKPHGESIGAALSAALPIIHFMPENADNSDDISTSNVYSKGSDLIDRHNNAKLLQRRGMYILWNQSFIAAYNYNDADEAYGTYPVKNFKEQTRNIASYNCPGCEGSEDTLQTEEPVNSLITQTTLQENEQAQPIEHQCQTCGYNGTVNPIVNESRELIELEEKFYPKTRECIEFYGRLNVQIPINIKKLIDAPYLILEQEQHYALMRKMYPEIANKITPGNNTSDDNYNRSVRTPVALQDEVQTDYVTHSRVWLRPWAFYGLEDIELAKKLEKEYPNGMKICMVNDMPAKIEAENMDEHWTLTENPYSEHIDADPMARCLVEIQESSNDLYTLIEDTVRQCIPDNYFDPDVLDPDALRDHRKRPGDYIPVRPKSGRNIEASFHSTKSASLSQEVEYFRKAQEQMAQFVVGDFPQIFGGQSTNETLGQDEMAKSQALQRLSMYWEMYNVFWAEVKKKATTEYLKKLSYDESYVKRVGNNYINVWIRRAEKTGKIGEVYADTSDQFPVTWAQKRGLFFQLLSMAKQQFDNAAFSPENTQFVKDMLQLEEFHVPGQSDRNRQLTQIAELLKSAPMMDIDQLTGEEIQRSSIPPDPDIDDNPLCIQTIRSWCVSEAGLDAKENNEQGYNNVRLQLSERLKIEQEKMQQMQEQEQMQAQLNIQEKPKQLPKNKPNGAIENPTIIPAGGGV